MSFCFFFEKIFFCFFFADFFCPTKKSPAFQEIFRFFENGKKSCVFFSDKKKSAKKNQKNIFSEKIKKTYSGVKHIQRRASNSFWARRTKCLKFVRVFGRFFCKNVTFPWNPCSASWGYSYIYIMVYFKYTFILSVSWCNTNNLTANAYFKLIVLNAQKDLWAQI